MVQLEVEVQDGIWKPVIRYDCAHDFAHRDRYNLRGDQDKQEIALSYAESLDLADKDINDNWDIYQQALSKRRLSMNVFEQKNAELVTEFDRYVREHPDFAERIPANALVAMLIEGDQEFNRWSQEGAQRQAEKQQPIVYVKIKRIQPIRSRIEEIEVSASG